MAGRGVTVGVSVAGMAVDVAVAVASVVAITRAAAGAAASSLLVQATAAITVAAATRIKYPPMPRLVSNSSGACSRARKRVYRVTCHRVNGSPSPALYTSGTTLRI